MLKHRVLTAIVLFGLTGLMFFCVPENAFITFIMLMCLLALHELLKMYKFVWGYQLGLIAVFVACLYTLTIINYDISQIVRMLTIIMWCFIAPLILVWQPKNFAPYVIILLGLLIFAPAFYAITVLHGLLGPLQLLSILAIAWVSDISAYFVGRKWGRRKLAPQISPGKSIEGAIAAVVCSIIYLAILKYYDLVSYLTDYNSVFKFGAILATVGIIGDLLESWLKRVAQVKDSGTLLPGHGGVYDRIDSLVAVVAVAFAMIRGLI